MRWRTGASILIFSFAIENIKAAFIIPIIKASTRTVVTGLVINIYQEKNMNVY